jgi:hypothetical protein
MEWTIHMIIVSAGMTVGVLVLSGLFAGGEKLIASLMGK